MKIKFFLKFSIIIIFALLTILTIFVIAKIKANNTGIFPIEYDDKIDENANFIDSTKSSNFNYAASITINGIKKYNNGFISLQYVIDITPKTDIIYKNVLATA